MLIVSSYEIYSHVHSPLRQNIKYKVGLHNKLMKMTDINSKQYGKYRWTERY